MNRRIAIVAATTGETQPFIHYLQTQADQHNFQTYALHGLLIDILWSGIGVMQSTYSLMDYCSHRHPDGWIQIGIGGAFDRTLTLGETYNIKSEFLIGFGAEEQSGVIRDPFYLGWNDPDAPPYQQGVLPCPYVIKTSLASVTGMTSFHAHGDPTRIALLQKGKTGQIESMEGAPFFYVSLLKKIPFLSFRSISNFVEPRDVTKWQINPAIENVNQALTNWLEEGDYNPDKLFGLGVR